jgi:hypothetical protein
MSKKAVLSTRPVFRLSTTRILPAPVPVKRRMTRLASPTWGGASLYIRDMNRIAIGTIVAVDSPTRTTVMPAFFHQFDIPLQPVVRHIFRIVSEVGSRETASFHSRDRSHASRGHQRDSWNASLLDPAVAVSRPSGHSRDS